MNADRIKEANRIEDVVGEVVELRRKGAALWGRCPFHAEKTPSFQVDPARNRYKCFGCHKGGDVIDFVQSFHGIDFKEAVVWLAERCGIVIEEAPDEGRQERSRLRGLYTEVQAAYVRALPGSAAAAYLVKRGLPLKVAEEFGLGFAHNELRMRIQPGDGLLTSDGKHPLIRSRLTIPIHSSTGEVIAFAGRALTDLQEPKYLNSPETAIYSKAATLYNLHRAGPAGRKAGRIIVTEGYFDVIASNRAGLPEAVAICGTALTEAHATTLRRHVDRIVLAFDGDEAGQQAIEKSAPALIKAGLEIRVCRLPAGQDIADLCRSEPDKYLAAIACAVDFWRYLLDKLSREHDMRSPAGAKQAIERVKPFAAALDAVQRSALAAELATMTGATQNAVEASLRSNKDLQQEKPASETLAAEAVLLRLFADDPSSRTMLAEALSLAKQLNLDCASALAILADRPDYSYEDWESRLEKPQSFAGIILAEGPRPSIADGMAALEALRRGLQRKEWTEALRGAQTGDDDAVMEALARLSLIPLA